MSAKKKNSGTLVVRGIFKLKYLVFSKKRGTVDDFPPGVAQYRLYQVTP